MARQRADQPGSAEGQSSRRTRHAAGTDVESKPSSRTRGERGTRRLSAAEAARLGLSQIVELTGKATGSVAQVEPADHGWTVGVEVVEDRRIPSSTDVLAIYLTELDERGDLISYRRIRRYKRGQGDSDNGGESW